MLRAMAFRIWRQKTIAGPIERVLPLVGVTSQGADKSPSLSQAVLGLWRAQSSGWDMETGR